MKSTEVKTFKNLLMRKSLIQVGKNSIQSKYNTRVLRQNPLNSTNSSSKTSLEEDFDEVNYDQKMEEIREMLSKKCDFSELDTEILSDFLVYIRDYAAKCGKSGNYDDADFYTQIFEKTSQEIRSRKNNRRRYAGNSNEIDIVKHENFNKNWEEKYKNFDEANKQKLEEIKKRHLEENENFEDLWLHKMPSKYRKPSSKLLQLKRIEKSLVSTGDYKRAKCIHQQAQILTQHEVEQAQEELIKDYFIAKKKLESKQGMELEMYNRKRELGLNILEAEKENDFISLKKRDNVLQNKTIKNNVRTRTANFALRERYAPQYVIKNHSENQYDDVLLPILVAPNDPNRLQQEKERTLRLNKKNLELQKSNAEHAINHCSTYPSKNELKLQKSGNSRGLSKTMTPNKMIHEVVIRGESGSKNVQVTYKGSENESSLLNVSEIVD